MPWSILRSRCPTDYEPNAHKALWSKYLSNRQRQEVIDIESGWSRTGNGNIICSVYVIRTWILFEICYSVAASESYLSQYTLTLVHDAVLTYPRCKLHNLHCELVCPRQFNIMLVRKLTMDMIETRYCCMNISFPSLYASTLKAPR